MAGAPKVNEALLQDLYQSNTVIIATDTGGGWKWVGDVPKPPRETCALVRVVTFKSPIYRLVHPDALPAYLAWWATHAPKREVTVLMPGRRSWPWQW